jgi:hypothetical protein
VVRQDLVDEAASDKYKHCWFAPWTYEVSGFRFQIINGTLWVDHVPWRHIHPRGVPDASLTTYKDNTCELGVGERGHFS